MKFATLIRAVADLTTVRGMYRLCLKMLIEKSLFIIVCPGIHEKALTDDFVEAGLKPFWQHLTTSGNILIVPSDGVLALSGMHILQFLGSSLRHQIKSPVIFISFSAGVVGAIFAASSWQLLGGNVKRFIAIDGWGVPLWGNFPIHRMSHDYYTHWSSKILGTGQDNFYASPPVDHLSMWRIPQVVQGRWVDSSDEVSPPQNRPKSRLSAAEFLQMLLNRD